jgi:stearoyl-CoA desaturase (delta-9 desaturase)
MTGRDILIGLGVSQLTLVVVSVYLHRGLAHRAIQFRPGVALPFRSVLWMLSGMRRAPWVAVHRYHHAHADDALDPHSPIHLGFWRVQLGDHRRSRRLLRDQAFVERYASDVRSDWLDRALFDHAWVGPALTFVAATVSLGLSRSVVIGATHLVASKLVGNTVAAVGHRFGQMPDARSAGHDIRLLALVSAGEGYHNSHHSRPRAAQFSTSRASFDLGWIVISGLARLRCVTIVMARPRDSHLAR